MPLYDKSVVPRKSSLASSTNRFQVDFTRHEKSIENVDYFMIQLDGVERNTNTGCTLMWQTRNNMHH